MAKKTPPMAPGKKGPMKPGQYPVSPGKQQPTPKKKSK